MASPGSKEPWQMTKAEYAFNQNSPKVAAIQEAIRLGKNIVLATAYRAIKLGRPEYIRITEKGAVQIPRGRKWDTLFDNQIDSLAEQAGYPVPPLAERKYHRTEIEQALSEGKPVPAEVLADYPDLKATTGTRWQQAQAIGGGRYLMVIQGPKHIAPDKMQQLLSAGKEQLNEEDYARLRLLLVDLQLYGLSAYLNAEIGKIMSGISWELAISESPEWEEALIACDAAFLGRELKDMCNDAGLSPQGHKKELCARLYEADVPEVLEIMEPFLEKAEILPQTEPLYRLPLREVKDDLEKLHRPAPMEFYPRRRVIERAIQERLRGEVKTMPEFTLSDLQELVRSIARLYQ